MFEKNNLACYDINVVVFLFGFTGPFDEFTEDRVVDNVGGDTVKTAGLADEDAVKVGSEGGGGFFIGDGADAVAVLLSVSERVPFFERRF